MILRLSNIIAAGAALLGSVALTGCFTGVESTPRITESQVRRDVGSPTAEEEYLDDISLEPFGAWLPGKCFIVTDEKIALLLNNRAAGAGPRAGSHLFYDSAKSATSVTGDNVTEITFIDSLRNAYRYTVAQRPDSLAGQRIAIPFTIEQTMVDRVNERLADRTFYVLTSLRRDKTGQTLRAPKFVPVTVVRVRPGNTVYPVAVEIVDSAGDTTSVEMNVERGARNPRTFANLFSFSDPRKKYPSITDPTWEAIVNNCVGPGMTREECRLSLGAPAEVDKRPGYSYLYESWRYDSGVYLIFEDGILTRFRR